MQTKDPFLSPELSHITAPRYRWSPVAGVGGL